MRVLFCIVIWVALVANDVDAGKISTEPLPIEVIEPVYSDDQKAVEEFASAVKSLDNEEIRRVWSHMNAKQRRIADDYLAEWFNSLSGSEYDKYIEVEDLLRGADWDAIHAQ
jgi:hypothetical protein